jgi:RimJ/RimL family protein N-acetyltransferase
VSDDGSDVWVFETDRLGVGPWHQVADQLGIDLAGVVAKLLTARTTEALPKSWQGEHSVESARGWINDRDADSSMLLVTESDSNQPVGLLVLAEIPMAGSGIDLRIGYLLAEHTWGRGLATELVSGLIDCARTQPRIHTLTGGVDPENRASVRVLEKCGFGLIDGPDPDAATYRFEITPSNEWDSYAPSWDADGGARAYSSAAFTSLRRILHDAEVALDDARVIDFGCGTGLLTERLVAAGATVEAVDTSTAMLAGVDSKSAEHGWTGVRTSTSLPDEYEVFDLVVCSSVCSFLDDYPSTVHELVARLREGGLFVQWDWERTDENSHGLTRTEIRETLTTAGLTDVTVSDAFSVSVDDQTMSPIVGHGQRPLNIAQP